MLGRIVAGVLVPVVIAASGYGGYVGMTKVIDGVEAEPGDTMAWSADANGQYTASNHAVTVTLPFEYTTDVADQVFQGMPVQATTWLTDESSAERNGEAYAAVVMDFSALAAGVSFDRQTALQTWLASAAGADATLTDEEPFTIGGDPARRAVARGPDGDLYLTAVMHGSVAVMVLAAGGAGSAGPPRFYDEVVGSIGWTS